MLIDHKMEHTDWAEGSHRFNMKHRYNARRFLISEEVTRAIAGLTRDYPELFVRNYQFALPPYETCYIEYPSEAWQDEFKAQMHPGLGAHDRVVGHMMHGGVISTIAAATDLTQPSPAPWMWSVEGEPLPGNFWHVPARAEHKLALVLGSTLNATEYSFHGEVVDDIDRRVNLWVDKKVDYPSFRKMTPNFVGELRTLWAILLWLNQPKHVIFESVAAHRGMVRNRSVAYAAHHIVRLAPGLTVRKMSAVLTDRAPPRRHEVRAFFRHYKVQKGCEHNWPILPDDEGHWQCSKCGGIRTRVKEHLRGDASRGFVTKEYRT
jgi:hypothetical protein